MLSFFASLCFRIQYSMLSLHAVVISMLSLIKEKKLHKIKFDYEAWTFTLFINRITTSNFSKFSKGCKKCLKGQSWQIKKKVYL